MKKYCNDCKREVEVSVNQEFEDGHLFYEEMFCTECGSDDLTEVGHCKVCGEPIGADESFCKSCLDDIESVLIDFAKHYKITVDVLEDLVSEYFNW